MTRVRPSSTAGTPPAPPILRGHAAFTAGLALAFGIGGLGGLGACVGEPPEVGTEAAALAGARLGDPLPDLDPELLGVFRAGEAAFEHELTVEEGLGPLFIESSCVTCHALGGVGGGDRLHDENHLVNRLPPAEVVQTRSIAGMGTACDITPEAVADGTALAARNPLQAFGDGLIDHLAPATIAEFVRAVPERGVRGKLGVGRFGWKAQSGTLAAFTAAAANGTMSLTTGAAAEQTRFGVAPAAIDPDCANAALGASTPNDDGHFLRAIIAWEVLLAPPERRDSDAAAQGEQVFADTGCVLCHRPTMTTRDTDYVLTMPDGTTRAVPQLRNRAIALYSDLLLHDMGAENAELIVQGNAAASELRTPPLWGVGHRARFLHDGSARSLDEAVRRHGGEAAEIRDAYAALAAEDRAHLLVFLNAL
jgi:CxxC motif-containing protein (DUF1111 family)